MDVEPSRADLEAPRRELPQWRALGRETLPGTSTTSRTAWSDDGDTPRGRDLQQLARERRPKRPELLLPAVRDSLANDRHAAVMYEFTRFEQERRLQRSLARARGLARDYEQELALEADLYILDRMVQVAVDSESEGLLEHAFEEVRLFEEKLLKAFSDPPRGSTRPRTVRIASR